MINNELSPLRFSQKVAVEVSIIKQIIEESSIEIVFKWIRGHQTIRARFKSNLAPYMVVIVDTKAKESRISNRNNPLQTNIKYYSEYSLKLNNIMISRVINQIIRIVDVVEIEK